MILTLGLIKEKQKELNELINFYSNLQKKYGKSVTNEELEEIKKQQEKIDEMIKAYEEQKDSLGTVWVPQDNETYFFINGDGVTSDILWDGSEYDTDRLGINNVFKTEEEAEGQIEWLKILYKLRTLGGDYWSDTKEKTNDLYIFGYRAESREITTHKTYGYQEHSLPIYFDTKEKVKNAIETIGEDRLKKYWFRVED